jgi:hypothetical protein
MLATIVDIAIVIIVLSVIGYLLVFGRSLGRDSTRFTDREARRSAADEQARSTSAARDLGRADDEGPQTD